MLRLVFHDAGTYRAASRDGGLNASIQFELDRPENKGLKRAWNVVQDLHKQLQVLLYCCCWGWGCCWGCCC